MQAGSDQVFRIVQSADTGLSSGAAPRISSLLIKPASALCNLDCSYCFYLDRETDPYHSSPSRIMTTETLTRLVDSYLFYSYPQSAFAFQGGEPTLAGLNFFRQVVELQKQYGRSGHSISNSIQTNGVLLTPEWCRLFREYKFLVGISLDGPEDIHDSYRQNKAGQGTWKAVAEAVALLRREQVEFNVLCVISQANVRRAKDVYQYFRRSGIDNLQFIPLAEFLPDGTKEPYAISGEEYGQFLCDLFDVWWPERRKVRVRYFDNIAEALAGVKPGTCTLHESCDSYAVVEHNGDVYPCDFFVDQSWKLGNIHTDSWGEIGRRRRRYDFASKKTIPHPDCAVCEFEKICHGGCPKLRHARQGAFEDLDWLCAGYKKIFAQAVPALSRDLETLGVLKKGAAVK